MAAATITFCPAPARTAPYDGSMIRSILTVSTGTLASRLLGFARDAMVAALLGAGPVADAFLVAFQLVNVIRRLLTEGALNAALIPAWLRIQTTQGAVAATAFAGRVLGTISVALIVATILIGFAMPLVIALLAPGFVGQPTLQLAVDNARLMLPYLAFAGPVTVMMGLLNAQQRFALTAFSPLLFNIALIAVMALLLVWRQEPDTAAMAMAATVGIAGLLQLLMLILRKSGGNLAAPLRLSLDSEMRGFFRKALPGMVANSGPQLLIVTGAIIASTTPAAVSWLYFANRLIELPLGIVGTAMGTVLVPALTRAVRSDDHAAIAQAESRGLELAIGLALPATLGLMILSHLIVQLSVPTRRVQRERHDLDCKCADMAGAGPARSGACESSVARLLRTRGHDDAAAGDADRPGRRDHLALVLNRPFGASGIAAAIALAAWGSAIFLIVRSAAAFGFSPDHDARRRLPIIVLASLAMGGLLWLAAHLVLPWAAQAHGLVQASLLGLLIVGGLAIYAVLLTLSGAVRWAEVRGALKRSPAAG
jgi:putative peptidoglycan lipid II flippase